MSVSVPVGLWYFPVVSPRGGKLPAAARPSAAPPADQGGARPLDEPATAWTVDARRKLLARRIGAGPASSRVHKPGVLAELSALASRAPESESTPISGRDRAAWLEMRRLLAEADADTYAAAKARAARLRERASLPLRCAIAFAFPTETTWSRDDGMTCLERAADGRAPPPCASLLFASIADADIAIRLLTASPPGAARAAHAAHALELVESMGAAAAPLLMLLFEEAITRKEVSGAGVRCLEALEIIRSPDVAAVLAKHLDANEVRPYAARYFQAAPRLGFRALAPLAASRGRAADAARTLLLTIVVGAEDAAAPILAELPSGARRALKAALDLAATSHDEASLKELPQVLAAPPWRRRSRRVRSTEDLTVIDERAPEGVKGRSRDEWASLIHWVPNSLVVSSRVAGAVAHAWIHRPELRAAAEEWLSTFPELAVLGIIPGAVSGPGPRRTDAGRMLRLLEGRGLGPAIRAAAARYGSTVASIVADVLALDPMLDCPEGPPRLPDFLRVDALPRPRLAGAPKALPRSAVVALCEMLAFSSEEFPYAGIEAVRAACDKASLEELVWGVVDQWLASGGSMKVPWPLRALAELGGDPGARRLAPKIRAWVEEKALTRAAAGVDALARIGTDVALMRLKLIADSPRSPELRGRARDRIAEVASARGLSSDELADRLVPDLDLDRDGSKILDYGPRSFRVGFDAYLSPFVQIGGGALLASLPRPTKADDPAKSKAAQGIWRALREDGEVIARGQVYRLELAMVTGRRWTPADLFAFIVNHPLMVHLARRLVFGAYDAEGRLAATFRVAEDRTLADERDEPCYAPENLAIGIPHPLDLSPGALAAWSGVLADYGVVQPFEQLGRQVYSLSEEERASSVLRRVEGMKFVAGKSFGVLERWGWRRELEAEGVILVYSKELPRSGRVAVLEIEPGIRAAKVNEAPEQRIAALSLMRDRTLSSRAPFRDLEPISASELIRDVERLCG